MLFDKAIHLTDECKLKVAVYTKNQRHIGSGDLHISPSRVPYLSLDPSVDVTKVKSNSLFLCQCEHLWFTLLECDVVGFTIYPRGIVNTIRKNGRFKKFSVIIQGLSDWMDDDGPVECKEGIITKKLQSKQFRVQVCDPDKGDLVISSENWWETAHPEANLFQVAQYSVITLELRHGYFSIAELIEKVYDIRNVFSLLLGYPLNIDYVFDRSKKHEKNAIYFPSKHGGDKPFDSKLHCLVSSSFLHRNNNWEEIFRGVYERNSDIFLSIWTKLAGTLGFIGFWEYKFLTHVALLDAYTTSFTAKYKSKLSNKKSITFKNRIDFAIENSNPDMINAIDFDSTDLFNLITLRNEVAHGSIPKTKNSYDLTYETILESKVLVLLLYWTYRDLGIDDKDIAAFFTNFLHPIIRNSRLNTQALDKITLAYPYLCLNQGHFRQAKKNPHQAVILEYREGKRNCVYHHQISQQVADKWGKREKLTKHRFLEELIGSIVDTKTIHAITYVGSAYIQNNDRLYKAHSVCILNAPKDWSSPIYRRWDYDHQSNVWHQ